MQVVWCSVSTRKSSCAVATIKATDCPFMQKLVFLYLPSTNSIRYESADYGYQLAGLKVLDSFLLSVGSDNVPQSNVMRWWLCWPITCQLLI